MVPRKSSPRERSLQGGVVLLEHDTRPSTAMGEWVFGINPGGSVGNPETFCESRCSHTNWDFLPNKWRTIDSRVHKKSTSRSTREKGRLNPSRDKN